VDRHGVHGVRVMHVEDEYSDEEENTRTTKSSLFQ
jgi:hypothetical protein